MNTKLITHAAEDLDSFRAWLRLEIAKSSDLGYVGLDFSMSIDQMGLSSVHVVRLTGEIEKLLDIEVDPTFLYDFPTVDELCETLMRMSEGKRTRSTDAREAALHVRIAATFTAEPIEETVRYMLGRIGLQPEVHFARYNQVFQELLSPHGELSSSGRGINVLLVRIEDWFRHGTAEPGEVERTVEDFNRALAEFAARIDQPLILALAPHSPQSVRALGLSSRLSALDERIVAAAERIAGLHLLDLRHIEEQFNVTRLWDEARDTLGHIPFAPSCFAALGASLARRISALLMGSAKVIVLDCDNTLWGGVTGEDGPEGVRIDGPFQALQSFMMHQQMQGKLLCLCSKNNEADVWATFDARPDMPLTRDHIVAHRVNWERKSANIQALADELSLGLDSFIFVDDNPMEVSEVQQALPEVLAICLPASPGRIPEFLDNHWAFDTLVSTEEDRQRTQMYKDNFARQSAQASASSFDDFLAQLDVRIDVGPLQASDLERAAQLTHRTNQFNANKTVYDATRLQDLLTEDGRMVRGVRVADRFGDYGFIGLMMATKQAGTLVCDTFLLSCRVLGRQVEHTMVQTLAKLGAEHGCEDLVLQFTEADRNQVAHTFFASFGAAFNAVGDGRSEVRFPIDTVDEVLAGTKHQLHPPSADRTDASPRQQGRLALAADGFADIATAGRNVDALQASITANSRLTRPELSTEYVTPRTAWEKKVTTIWREVLRIDRVGIYDSFYELGGDSLRAAEAFARMWDLGVPESISLQTIPDPTVSGLAVAIEEVNAGLTPTLLSDRFSLADEGQLPDDIRHEGFDVATYARPMERVFLTGGTGYIGAFLIHELMTQTDVIVRCLVRAATPEDGHQRVRSNMRRYGLWQDAYAERLDMVLGDLTEAHFGLGEASFRELAKGIDTIVHSAAWVNFVYPYSYLKATNVDATETVLRLAIADLPQPIQVHFVSTLGVIMSTGYGRDNLVSYRDPLIHADDLLNGYEQTKYSSDKMVWTAMQERGIPGNIYRPGMVGGLSDGLYHKLDEFMPQYLKGCIQLGAWPVLDTRWEMAPIDFISKSIVHIAKNPAHLNQAFFTLHPESASVSEFIDWHRSYGYEIRALPWAVWKRELLNLGTDRLRKNALFPFVDFIRALSADQVYFPPSDKSNFLEAIADMDYELPPALEQLQRYTDYFVDNGFYANLPSGPRSRRANEKPREVALTPGGRLGDQLDEHIRFDHEKVDASEAYYILWNDPEARRQMVIRYVLHNGPIDEAKVAEVWCWFRDQDKPANDIAIRQRYPLARAEIVNSEDVLLQIGPSGYGPKRAWGTVEGPAGTVSWDFALDASQGMGVDRLPEMAGYDLIPHFQSNGVKMAITGEVVVNGVDRYALRHHLASDGHYWNTKHLKSWSWAHCADFEGDDGFLFEGIAPRFNDWGQPSVWLTFVYKGEVLRSNLVDAFYFNRELDADLTSWRFIAEHGTLRFVGTLTARPEDQTLIVHPLPDDEFLYTHITYCGDMAVDIQRKEGGKWWTFDRRTAKGTASFEVTRKERNPDVEREFRIVRRK